MPLNNEQKKQYKSIGHDLKPVLIVAGNGLNEASSPNWNARWSTMN